MNSTPNLQSDGAGADASPAADAGSLAGAKSKIAETARDIASQAKAAATTAVGRARDEAGRMATEKKDQTADRIGDYSSAIHDSADRLEEKDPNIAWFTHQAAEKIQGVADYMRQTNLASLRTDCERIARKHPAAFFGGLFVAGLILGNVVKASRRGLDDNERNNGGGEKKTEQPERLEAPEGDGSPVDLRAAEREAAGVATPQI